MKLTQEASNNKNRSAKRLNWLVLMNCLCINEESNGDRDQ